MRMTWGFFPYAVVLGLALVAVVDGSIAWTALRTFPGVVTHSQFTDSNRYDALLENAAREAALGWKTDFSIVDGLPRLVLLDRDGHRLEGARVAGQAIRPLGNSAPVALTFRAAAPGEYLAETRLVGTGQWEIDLTAAVAGKRIHLARRLVLP